MSESEMEGCPHIKTPERGGTSADCTLMREQDVPVQPDGGVKRSDMQLLWCHMWPGYHKDQYDRCWRYQRAGREAAEQRADKWWGIAEQLAAPLGRYAATRRDLGVARDISSEIILDDYRAAVKAEEVKG